MGAIYGSQSDTEVGFGRGAVAGSLVGTVLGVESLDEVLFSIKGLHSAGCED